MDAVYWYLCVGVLLCAMALAATLIRRLPLSTAMLYVGIGWVLGPNGLAVIKLDLVRDAHAIEQITQVIILLSIFSAGLKMRVPVTSRLWLLSLRLAFPSMILTAGLIALTGVYLFHLPWGIAILMGGILSPTDPVLASDVQIENPYRIGTLRFALTSEAGLNDGSAFPVVILGLLLVTGPFQASSFWASSFWASSFWRWFGVDLCWGTAAGLAVGFGAGALLGKYVLHLRAVHREAIGLGYFLAPGLIAMSYALGEVVHGYGFLSVFASAVTLRWMELRQSASQQIPEIPLIAVSGEQRFEAATNPETAPVFLVELLLQFTDELEQIGEIVVVVMVGALLTAATFGLQNILRLLLLFLLIRPIAIFAGLAGSQTTYRDRALIGWFGIRGIGSLYYLAYALQHGLPQSRMTYVAETVLAAIAISVAAHGISVTPMLKWYSRRQSRQSLSA